MWGKILIGAAVGVGAVAAAPFTGGGSVLGAATLLGSLTGAGTIAGALGAGVVGAGIGGVMGQMDEDELTAAKEAAEAKGKAKNELEINKLTAQLKAALQQLASHDEYFNALIALHAVAVSCANCDGEFSAEEKEEIEQFVHGMSVSNIPVHIRHKLLSIYQSPPTPKEAYTLALASKVDMQVYFGLITCVINADKKVVPAELAYMETWRSLQAA